jgi:hypothetical protein
MGISGIKRQKLWQKNSCGMNGDHWDMSDEWILLVT